MKISRRTSIQGLAGGLLGAAMGGRLASAKSFLDVGKQADIQILINASPWLPGFQAVSDLYVQQTGNKVSLEVAPYGGVLEKARAAVRGDSSPYDIVNLDTQWTIEFYEGGFLTPLQEIDPSFDLPPEVFRYDDSGYWNAEKGWRTAKGGTLMAYSPNGNLQLLFYRRDLYEQAGLKPPETFEELIAAGLKIQHPPELYGMVPRGERGNPIRFNWMPYMLGYGASITKDPENGDFTVTINSPKAKAALDLYLDIAKRCGPPNVGAIGQSRMIQLLATGKALQAIAVAAAWPTFDDPNQSVVVGKMDALLIPRPKDGVHGSAIGNWHFGVPKTVPEDHKKAAIAFSRWFLTYEAQLAYAEAGGIPVRRDVFASDLAKKEKFRWMKAYLDTIPYAKQVLGYREGAQVEAALGLRLNQAVVGELTSAAALNAAADDIFKIFKASNRKTGMLEPLPA